MKTTVLVFLLCIAFASADLAFLDHILKHTKVSGKVNLDTSKGIGLDYKGGIDYDDNLIKLDLLKVGAKFSAEAEKPTDASLGNHTAHAVKYQGAFNVNQGGETAHVATNGLAKLQADWQVGKDNSVTFKKLLTNVASWNATHNQHFAAGNHTGAVGAQGQARWDKNHNIYVNEVIKGGAKTDGTLGYLNGTVLGNFSAEKVGQAVVQKQIAWNPNATKDQPNFYFRGATAFNKKGGLKWNNDTWGHVVQGQAKFAGKGWAVHNAQEEDNTTLSGITVDKNAIYQYQAVWGKNGKAQGQQAGVGEVDVVRRLKHHNYKNGTNEFTLFTNGEWTQNANTVVNDKDRHVTVEKLNADGLSLDHVKDLSKGKFEDHYDEKLFDKPLPDLKEVGAKVIKSHAEAVWKDGAITVTQPDEQGKGTSVNTVAGAAWAARGKDNVHGNWNHTGNRTVNADFTVTNGGNQVQDVNISFGNEGGFLGKVARVASRIQRFVDNFRGQ